MKNNLSVSILIPAYNEEGNIKKAIKRVEKAVKKIINDYEILVINDGSIDKTGQIARELAKKNKKIRLIDRKINKGFGYSFQEGIVYASKDYLTQFHADNDADASCVSDLIKNISFADIITNYPKISTKRSFIRRLISKSFVVLMNLFFCMNLKYFNGTFICKTKLLRGINLVSSGFAIYAEAKVRLIKKGYSYKEIPFEYIGRKSGCSKSLNIKNIIQTFRTIFLLMRDIYLDKKI